MKKVFYISIYILVSCSSRNATELQFDQFLPDNDLTILTKMVNSYDDLIKTKYKGELYYLLDDVINGNQIFQQNDSSKLCDLIKEFELSTLEFKSEKTQYDSVYASNYYKIGDDEQFSDEPIIMTITQEHDTSWIDFVAIGVETVEEKIHFVKEQGYWKHISESSFVNSLIELNSKDENILSYIDRRQAVGYVNPKVMAEGIMENKINHNDYLIKRIIVFELYRNLIKEVYGC